MFASVSAFEGCSSAAAKFASMGAKMMITFPGMCSPAGGSSDWLWR